MTDIIIIDDEDHHIITLSKLLLAEFSDLKIAGTANNIAEGALLIKRLKPGLVFLDIEFPGESGFDLFTHFNNKIDFDVIFVSSHQEYAIKAIKFAAFDYIVKPVNPNELKNAMERYNNKQHTKSYANEKIELLLESFKTNTYKKIALTTTEGIRIVMVDDIIRCEADSSYCHVFSVNKEKITFSKNLKDIEEMLPPDIFLRVHRSHLVNINQIREYSKKGGGTVITMDGSEIIVSHRKRDLILEAIKKLTD